MTEEEKAIIMYRLHGCAKQYAISKVVEQRWDLISIHAPRVRGDYTQQPRKGGLYISIHAPRVRGDAAGRWSK